MNLHERMAAVLARSGALATALRVRRHAPVATLAVVTFHRIAELDPASPYDPDVIDATPDQFRRHVETLARAGTPIDLATVQAALAGAALPPNPILITFDDGYRSGVEIALPILRAAGVPATFFIATAFASDRTLYWWEHIAVYLARAQHRTCTLAYPRALTISVDDPRARRTLLEVVKNTRGLDVPRFLGELRTALGVPWDATSETALADELILAWDDIRALAAGGMDIGSHTRRHRVLETLAPDELHDELAGSRADLEARLGRAIRAIAYPVGRPPPPRVLRAAAEAGYEIGFANNGGVNHLSRQWLPDPLQLRRLPTERSESDAMFLTSIALPALAQ